MGRSNAFKNIESEFKFIGKEELKEIARESLGEILEALSSAESGEKLTFMLLLLGAKFGVSCDGVMNVEEKELINEIFGPIWTGDISEIYKMIGTELTEQDYGMVENITFLGNDVVMPFLHFILCFAYIDGVFEDEVADRLDGLFGVNLLMDFMQSEETKKNAAAEEKRRKQEEKAREEKTAQDKFKAEMDAWTALSQERQAKREEEKNAGYEEIEASRDKKRENINERRKKALDELNAKIKTNKDSLETHKQELASLGVLKFVRKQELNKIIQREEAVDTELQFEIKQQTQKFNDELVEVDKWIAKAKKDLAKSIAKKYPIPESPEQIRTREEAERKEKERIANFFAGEDGKVKKAILEVLSDSMVKTKREIRHGLEDIRIVTYGKMEELLAELDKEGYIEHTVYKGETYYKILKNSPI